MQNKKVLSICLVLALLVSCVAGVMIFGASAATETKWTVDGTQYANLQAAIDDAATKTWAAGDELVIEITATADQAVKAADGLLFGAKTIFRADNTRLPITIKGGVLKCDATITGDVACANNYTFDTLSFDIGEKDVALFAGSGEVTFKTVTLGAEGYTAKARFFADNCTAKAFQNWTDANKTAAKVGGYVETSIHFSGVTYASLTYDFGTSVDGKHTYGNDDLVSLISVIGNKTDIADSKVKPAEISASIIADEGSNIVGYIAYRATVNTKAPVAVINVTVGNAEGAVSKFRGIAGMGLPNTVAVPEGATEYTMVEYPDSDINLKVVNSTFARPFHAIGGAKFKGDITAEFKNVTNGNPQFTLIRFSELDGSVTVNYEDCNFKTSNFRILNGTKLSGNLTSNAKNCIFNAEGKTGGIWFGGTTIYVDGTISHEIKDCDLNGTLYLGPASGGSAKEIVSVVENVNVIPGNDIYLAGTISVDKTSRVATSALLSVEKVTSTLTNVISPKGVLVSGTGGEFGDVKTTINGGEFGGAVYGGAGQNFAGKTHVENLELNITGGTFKSGVYGSNGSGKIPEGGTSTITNSVMNISGGEFLGKLWSLYVSGESAATISGKKEVNVWGDITVGEGASVEATAVPAGKTVTVHQKAALTEGVQTYANFTVPKAYAASVVAVAAEGSNQMLIPVLSGENCVIGVYTGAVPSVLGNVTVKGNAINAQLLIPKAEADAFLDAVASGTLPYTVNVSASSKLAGAITKSSQTVTIGTKAYYVIDGIPAVSAGDLDAEITYTVLASGKISIADAAKSGAALEGASDAQKALCNAVANYSIAANNILAGKNDALFATPSYTTTGLAVAPTVNKAANATVNFKKLSLLMGDTIGIRLTGTASGFDPANTVIKVNGEILGSSESVLKVEGTTVTAEFFIAAEYLSEELTITVETGDVKDLELVTSVEKIAAYMVSDNATKTVAAETVLAYIQALKAN